MRITARGLFFFFSGLIPRPGLIDICLSILEKRQRERKKTKEREWERVDFKEWLTIE